MAISYEQDVKLAGDWRFGTVANPTGSAVDKIKQLEAYYFYFNELGQKFGFGREEVGHNVRQIGLIAQELAAVEPSLVIPMDWLGQEEEYYAICYDTLNALILDAVNELNTRADAIKTQLGMTVETYPTYTPGPELQVPTYEITGITADPVNAPEGTTVTWTITGNNVPEGVVIPFRFDGNFNWEDITVPAQDLDSNGEATTYVYIWEPGTMTGEDLENEGRISGTVRWGTGNSVNVKLHYVSDGVLEGPETITMSLKANDSLLNPLPNITATGTILDS